MSFLSVRAPLHFHRQISILLQSEGIVMARSLEGKVAVVTGSSRGLGVQTIAGTRRALGAQRARGTAGQDHERGCERPTQERRARRELRLGRLGSRQGMDESHGGHLLGESQQHQDLGGDVGPPS